MSEKVDLSALSAEELQQALDEKKKAEKAEELKIKKTYEQDKNDFVNATTLKFKQLNTDLSDLKNYTITEANKLYARMYEINGKEPREVKSFQLLNDAGDMKMVVAQQDRFEFTEEADVHLSTIQDMFKEKFAPRNKGFYGYLESVLMKNSKNEYDPKLLYKIRAKAKELGDKALLDEVDKLTDCQRVVGTGLYCRVYVKHAVTKKWVDISLQFSAL